MGTTAKRRFTYNQPFVQKTLPVIHRVKYCIIRMSIKPEQVANADKNIFFKLLLFSNRIAELTRIELDKKKMKNNGTYIGIKTSVIGRNIRTPKNTKR